MPLTQLPPSSQVNDADFVSVSGPDNISLSFLYDRQQHAYYTKESQVLFPSHHGKTHIGDDPIPLATCDTVGLMAADDKCKLDALLQTRLGVLGFMGAGFPDDGGWLQGDIILAAGTEFIHLERIGNVIRFTVDSPIPLNCACFQAGARVLMHDGTTKAIEDVAVGDLVVTHRGRPKRVTQLFRNHHDGPMYRWKADKHSGEGFTVTGNHPVMALERAHVYMPSGKARKVVKERPRWIDAEQLRAGDLIERRRSHTGVGDVQSIDVLTTLGDGFIERDGLVYPIRPDGFVDGQAHGIPRFILVNNDFLDLLGYYAAEGCASRKNGVRFTVHRDELVFGDIGGEIRRILASLFGMEPYIYDRTPANAYDIKISSVTLSELFRRWFGSRKQKRFPEWVMCLPSHKQARVVAALMRGDGYVDHHPLGAVYFQLWLGSRFLVDQALFMAERCNWEPAHQEPTVHVDGRIRYRMSVTASNAPTLCDLLGVERQVKMLHRERRVAGHVLHRIASHSTVQYTGTVYNFEVQGDNSYVVDGIVVHNCEECLTLYWVQDETDISGIRPPTCGGKLPSVNSYGEMKVFLFPESTLVDPANTAAALNNKGFFPSFTFKRYQNSIAPGLGEVDVVLKRNAVNRIQAEVGWSMTPGPAGLAECVWFMGTDNDGNLMRFDLGPNMVPGLLGALLYKGNLLTKQMAVITDYTPSVLTNNQYQIRLWDVLNQQPQGPPQVATNIWRYTNPQGPASGPGAVSLNLDIQTDVLPIGTLVDIWYFQIGQISGTPINRYFFVKQPIPNPANQWTMVGGIDFADLAETMTQQEPGAGTGGHLVNTSIVTAVNDFENSVWGLASHDDPLLLLDNLGIGLRGTSPGTGGGGTVGQYDLNRQHRAVVDPNLPGLKIMPDIGTEPFAQRPVILWNRLTIGKNVLIRAEIGQPAVFTNPIFPPYDFLVGTQVASYRPCYVRIMSIQDIGGLSKTVRVEGAGFNDLPRSGSLRVLWPAARRGLVWDYSEKFVFPSADRHDLVLSSNPSVNRGYQGQVGDICELLHQEYSATCVRLQFTKNVDGSIGLQFKVGILGLELPYELGSATADVDDFVRGMRGGHTVSAIYTQAATWDGVGQQPSTNVDGFAIFQGGIHGNPSHESWNILEMMVRGNQLWVWWNALLIPPSPQLSNILPLPVNVTTPYFPVNLGFGYGKTAVRLWPGACMRRMEVRTQPRVFSEFTYGQLALAT